MFKNIKMMSVVVLRSLLGRWKIRRLSIVPRTSEVGHRLSTLLKSSRFMGLLPNPLISFPAKRKTSS